MHGVDDDHLADIKVGESVKLGPASGMLFDECVASGFGSTLEVFLLKAAMLGIGSLRKA